MKCMARGNLSKDAKIKYRELSTLSKSLLLHTSHEIDNVTVRHGSLVSMLQISEQNEIVNNDLSFHN